MLYLKNISKSYQNGRGTRVLAVDRVSLTVTPNEFVCILGRSGCGKTTTLRMIAGLEKASQGAVYLNQKKIRGPGPERCVVFQQYTLFPWRTVLQNVSFGLEMQGVSKKQRMAAAAKYLSLVGLGDHGRSYPHELSGGMQQRVAVARALAADPQVLLMDEPFGALDAGTRVVLQKELIGIWQKSRKTILFVTHSISESLYLADRIVIMKSRPGRIHKVIDNPLPRPRKPGSVEMTKMSVHIQKQLEGI